MAILSRKGGGQCMKKQWKIFWAICGSLAAIGVICCIIGVILGGSFFRSIVKDRDLDYITFEAENDLEVQGEEQQTFYGIKELDVDVSQVNVQLEEYDGRYLTVETVDIPDNVLNEISYTADESSLEIELEDSKRIKKLLSDNTKATIRIKVPSRSLQEADISVGAGSLYISQIQVEELKVEVGAGQAKIEQFVSNSAEFYCGAGEMQIAGEAESTEVECGVGSIIYQAKGREDEYKYQVESSLGEVTVGDRSYDGIGSGAEISRDGAKKELYIKCGIGQVQVEFQK